MMPPRGPQRRAEDLDREVGRWAALILLHRGKLIAIATALASLVTWFLTTAGMSYSGPTQAITKLNGRVDTLSHRVDTLESHDRSMAQDVHDIRRDLIFVVYMQCLQIRSGDKYALDTCAKQGPHAPPTLH